MSKQQTAVIVFLSVLVAALLAVCTVVIVQHNKKNDTDKAGQTAEAEGTTAVAETQPTTSVIVPQSTAAQTGEGQTVTQPPQTATQTVPATATVVQTTTVAPAPPAADTGKIVTPTDQELKELTGDGGFINMLNMSFMPEAVGPITIDFDCTKLDTAAVKRYLFFLNYSRLYNFHYGEPQTVETELALQGNSYYSMYPEENILWLARKVLNYTGTFDAGAFEAAGSGGNPNACTLKDGVFYFTMPGFDTAQAYPDQITAAPLSDGKYKVTVTYQYWYDIEDTRPVPGEGEVIVALKEADGKRFWSVYSYRAELNVP